MPRPPLPLLQGTLDLLVLHTIKGGPMHGYAVSRRISERTDGAIGIDEAALYKALHRLARAGYVEAEWGLSENKRRARYYALTVRGCQQLETEERAWRLYAEAMFTVLRRP